MNTFKKIILYIMKIFRKAIYREANINYDPTWLPTGEYCITQEVTPEVFTPKWVGDSVYCVTEETSITELTINSSEPTVGGGMLDFLGGEPNEILQLLLNVTIYDSNFASLDFDAPLTANSIGTSNLSEGGSISLDSNGNARVPYHYINLNTAFSCSIQITGRSSLKPIPEIDRTIITNS